MTKEERIVNANEALCSEFEADMESIAPEKNLTETLDLDSLDIVDVVVVVDEVFGVTLVKEDFNKIKTFDDFYNLIFKKING